MASIAMQPTRSKKFFRTIRRGWAMPGIPLFIAFMLLFTGVFADFISPFDPVRQRLIDSLTPPAWVDGGNSSHWLGTDKFGRDVLSRIIHGARVSLVVSLSTIAIGGGLGLILGMLAGYFAGIWEVIIMRLADLFLAFPTVLLAIILAVIFGASFGNVVLVVSILLWPRFARVARAETLGIKENEFVVYARTSGTPVWRIFARHIFPNLIPTLLVLVTWEVGAVILLESALSFLGAGIPPPAPSWGTMVLDGRDLLQSAWWISLFPGLAILITVLSLNMLGDWLRDWLDPKLRQV